MISTSFYPPLWVDVMDYYLWPTLMAASLVAWILSGRRWNSYAYWVIVALGLMWIGFAVKADGWERFLFQEYYPQVTVDEKGTHITSIIGWSYSRWAMRVAAQLMTWTVVLLSLSAPFWRKWLRRKLGLRDN